jgi:hypothetical protein
VLQRPWKEGEPVPLQHVLYAPLPDWARPDNIIQQYAHGRRSSLYWQLILTLLIIAMALSLLLATLIVYMGDPHKWTHTHLFYFPLQMMQLLTLVLALFYGSTAVTTERQRGTWEAFKINRHGAELVIRARWAAVLYQLRGPLLMLMVLRLVFAGLMVENVTGYEGYHLDVYLHGITPDVPLGVAVVSLAALMTAALLELPVLVGLNAALGLLISTVFFHRTAVFAARIAVLLVEIVLVAVALQAGWHVLDRNPFPPATVSTSTETQWLDLLLMGTLGDQGLRFMDLDTALHTWADVDYGVLWGGVLLLVVAVQIVLINGLLALITRRASHPLKE